MESAYKFYQRITQLLVAYNNCIQSDNKEWELKHRDNLEDLVRKYLPHGSGFDSGTKFNWERSYRNKLCFITAFHHMDENGMYSGWTEHEVIVTPDLLFGFNLKITGKNRNDIKEYIHSCFSDFEYKGE